MHILHWTWVDWIKKLMIDEKKKAKIYLNELRQNLPQDYKEEEVQGKLLSWAKCSLSFQNKQPTAFFYQ